MAEHDIKGNKLQINRILSREESKIVLSNVLSYANEFTLDDFDLVYKKYLDDILSNAHAFFGNFDTTQQLQNDTNPKGDGAYAYVGTGANFIVYFWDDAASAWVEGGGGSGGGSVFEMTYSEIDALRLSGNLIPFSKYTITDHVTKHRIPTSTAIHTGTPEPLVITAKSSTEFFGSAKSITHPNHKIEYRFLLNVCEDNSTPRPGMIISREDPGTRTFVGCDYLNVVQRRYKVLDKQYREGVKVSETNLAVSVSGNAPLLNNRIRYEARFEIMTHSAGAITITFQYSGVGADIIKPVRIYDNNNDNIPANYFSNKRGTLIYNNILDAFIFMDFTDIGSEIIGTYSGINPFGPLTVGHNISFDLDPADYEDVPIFNANHNEVYIPTNHLNLGTDNYYPNTVFRDFVWRFSVESYIYRGNFLKGMNRVYIGGYASNVLCVDSHQDMHIDTFLNNVLFAKSIGGFGNINHRFYSLDQVTLTPIHNMHINSVCQASSLIFSAGSNFLATASISESNIFVGGINVGGSYPNNFYIAAPLYRTLIGYVLSQSWIINKILNGQTIFERHSIGSNGENLLGATKVDTLNIDALQTASGSVVLLGRDENGNIVPGGFDPDDPVNGLDSKVDKASIVDNLTSTDPTTVLSGNQGSILIGHINNINAILASDDTTLDEIQELVNYIKQNRDELENLTIANIADLQNELDAKVAITSIIDNLISTAINVPLSANQGRVLNNLIDDINLILASDDPALDTLQKIVDLIKTQGTKLDNLQIADISGLQLQLDSKINTAAIVDNLTSVLTNVPLSANQGRILKGFIDTINLVLVSDDPALDTIQKIVDLIKTHSTEIANLDSYITQVESDLTGTQIEVSDLHFGMITVEASIIDLQTDKLEISAIVDNLTSTATDAPVSANQARILKGLIDNINTLLASDDTTLDEIQEIVDYIKQNKTELESLTISNIAGLVDALALKVEGSGTENYLPKFDSSGKVVGNSRIVDFGDNIQIGLEHGPMPAVFAPKLTVVQDSNTMNTVIFQNLNPGTSAEMRFVAAAADGSYLAFAHPSGANTSMFFGAPKHTGSYIFTNGGSRNLYIGTRSGTSNGDVHLATNDTPRVSVLKTGQVGFGTKEPTEQADINGNLRIRSINNATGEVVTVSPEGVITKRTLAEFLNDLGIDGAFVRDLITNLVGEAKLSITALKDQHFLSEDQFVIIDGVHTIITDAQPTENSDAFLTSGDIFTALENTGVPDNIAKAIPGYNPTFTKVTSPDDSSHREVIGMNGIVLASLSSGDSSRIIRSEDGINFYKISVGFIDIWGIESSPQGTLIGVGRNAGPNNIIRSTNYGLAWSIITAPITRSLNRVIYHRGVWMACARDGVGNRALYSTDDGLTWLAATTSEDNPYNDIVAKNGIVLLVGESGTNRIQRSTDLGQTYSNISAAPARFYTRARVFKNKFVLMQGGTGSTDKLAISDDGLTYTSAFTPVDTALQLFGMEVIGDYLFLVGKAGAMFKTLDLINFEAVDSGTTNDIYGISLTFINGHPVINTVAVSGTGDRITTSMNIL